MKLHCLHIQPMKRLILMGWIILTSLTLYPQQTVKKINIQIQEATLKVFIQKIEEITDYSFIYSEDVGTSYLISLQVKNATLEEVLAKAFEYQPISWKISGKHILLQKTKPKPAVRKFTISGYITDRGSKETLIGANVLETLGLKGTTTNAYGFYTLTLPEGEARLGFSYLGYASQMHHITLRKDTVMNIPLDTNTMLEEVVVLSDRVEAGLMSTHTGAMDIPISHVKNTPTILGEADVMKTIQLMPGVQSGIEGSAGLYIRGGSPDQNLVLLDGVPVYNVDHVLGFFSIFTPEAVKKVTLFKGSFPARFGGRLSSVVDVRTNDGDMSTYHGMLSIGLLTSKLNVEGPIVKDRTSFSVSLRRSYLDLITRPFMDEDEKLGYYFYDINAKINHRFSDKNRLYLSLYHGKDFLESDFNDEWGSGDDLSFDHSKTDLSWGNIIMSLRWNNVLNNKLFSNTTLSYNQYNMDANGESHLRYNKFDERYRSNYNSGIQDWSGQMDFDYTPNPKHHIKFGGSYTYHRFKPEVVTSRISSTQEAQDSTYRSMANSQIQANELSVYVEDNVDLTPKLRMNLGLHLSSFHVQGKSYFSLQPRLSARYQLNQKTILKASYSQMNQYVNLLTSAPISMPTDLWVPVTKSLKPMRSRQYAFGGYYTGLSGWEFSMEGYYKAMSNILEYKDATRFIGSSASWEEKVEMGKGRSFGTEFMVQRTIGQTTGWLSYTWAKSDRKFEKGGINNGERFPFKYDRRHHVNLVVNHKFTDRIDINASWFFATGNTSTVAEQVAHTIRPHSYYYTYTPSSGYGEEVITEEEYVENRNNFRLPASHRLNIGINFHKKIKRGIRTWNISVYNVYNSMNPTFVRRTYKPINMGGYPDGDGSYTGNYPGSASETIYKPVLKKLTLLPCIPSVTYTYRF